MATKTTVRYDRRTGELTVRGPLGETSLDVYDEGYSALREMVDPISAADLRTQLVRARWAEGPEWEIGLYVSEVEASLYDPEYSSHGPVALVIDSDGRLVVDVDVFVSEYPEDDPAFTPAVERLLAPMLARRRADLVAIDIDGHYVVPPYLLHIRLRPVMRGRSVSDLLDLGHAVEELIDAASGDRVALIRETVRDLVRGGRADVLLGQPEGPWLDVKKQSYDLTKPAGKISLAQAVARFANGEVGGLLVVGMGTRAVAGGEIIHSINPVPVDGTILRRHAQAIDSGVFPPPDLLTVEAVSAPGDGSLIMIDIPPQPEELKPFLVHGAVVDGKVEGAFISIVRRRGEHSIPITAEAIHSTLAAGRALLRRGALPEDTHRTTVVDGK